MSTFITIIGILGAIALLYGYGKASMGKMSPDGVTYQVLNFTGAATLAVNSAYHAAWPSAILNAIWSLIGVLTLSRLVARGAARREDTAADAVLPQSPADLPAGAPRSGMEPVTETAPEPACVS